MKMRLVVISLAMLLISAAPSSAAVLTFDDLAGTGVPIGSYGGLSWSENFYQLDGSLGAYTDTGYDHGRVSGNHVAYNGWERVVAVSDSAFDFTGAWLTGAWNDGLSINVTGWSGATQLYDNTVTVNTAGATWFAFDYLDVDRLVFSSFGGIPNPAAAQRGGGLHFVMDNFTINESGAVPEPSTLIIWSGLGAIGLAAVWRRRKRTAA
jgi:hypothetical protein